MAKFPEICTKVQIASVMMRFVGFEECVRNVSLVNKTCYRVILRVFLQDRPDVIAAKPLPASWDTFITIVDLGRHLVFKLGLIKLSPEGTTVLEASGGDIARIKDLKFGQDLANLTASMYTFWGSTTMQPERGIYHYIEQLTEDEPELHRLQQALKHDAQYWQSSRVYGKWIVLFERPDGTIIVSEDCQQVYLVVGISQSLAAVANMKQLGKKQFVHNPSYRAPHFHGPVIGMKCAITLLNWEGKILYDGIVRPLAQVTSTLLHQAIHAYIKAMNEDTLITQLPLSPPVFHTIEEVNMLEVAHHAEQLHYLYPELTAYLQQQTSTIPSEDPNNAIIGMIRAGYTEQSNPHHLLVVMNLSTGQTLFTTNTTALSPTLTDYCLALRRLCLETTFHPAILSIDCYEAYHVMKIFGETYCQVPVHYYPPPSREYFDLAKTVASFVIKSYAAPRGREGNKEKMLRRSYSHAEGDGNGGNGGNGNGGKGRNGNWLAKRWKSVDAMDVEEEEEEGEHVPRRAGPQCAYCGLYRSEPIEGEGEGEGGSGTGLRKFFRCGRCRAVYYCCKDHQVSHWKEHGTLCCFPIATSASASFSILPNLPLPATATAIPSNATNT